MRCSTRRGGRGAAQTSQETGVTLGPPELLVLSTPVLLRRRPALSTTLAVVVPGAESSQVGIAVIVARSDVVHVGCELGASRAVVVSVSAPVTVSPKDAQPDLRPVRGKSVPPI